MADEEKKPAEKKAKAKAKVKAAPAAEKKAAATKAPAKDKKAPAKKAAAKKVPAKAPAKAKVAAEIDMPAEKAPKGTQTGKELKGKTVKVTLTKSPIGRLKNHKACLSGLGLKKIRQTVEVLDTPANRGMINKVAYMVSISE